jgi:histidyl-tRNA synthetase
MFRYERPQKGRMRQFHQVGVELLGPTSPMADAEVIALGAMMLDQLGVLASCRLHLNSLGDAESRAAYRSALVAFLSGVKDQLSEDSQRRLDTNPLRILDSKDEGDRELIANAPLLGDYLNEASTAHIERVMEQLAAAGVAFERDPKLVRGLDYYCHTAFEFITSDLGAQGTVLGGGRYDGLAETLGGPNVAGVGWAAGVERLALLSGQAPRLDAPLVLIALPDAEGQMSTETQLFALANQLRQRGIRVEMPFSGNLGKQLKRADKLGARYVGIFGADEAAQKALVLRDMQDGSQTNLGLDAAVDHLSSLFQDQS